MVKKLNVIIVGSGSLGASLTKRLSEKHNITVIDENEHAFAQMGLDYGGATMVGDATNTDVLKRAGIAGCDILVAATSHDNVNLFVSLVAKEIYKVNRVISRLYDEGRAAAYNTLGIDIICPSILASEALSEKIKDLV